MPQPEFDLARAHYLDNEIVGDLPRPVVADYPAMLPSSRHVAQMRFEAFMDRLQPVTFTRRCGTRFGGDIHPGPIDDDEAVRGEHEAEASIPIDHWPRRGSSVGEVQGWRELGEEL